MINLLWSIDTEALERVLILRTRLRTICVDRA